MHDGHLALAGLALGNVFVALQPPRGHGMDQNAIYHQPDLPPPHNYHALYRWLRDVWLQTLAADSRTGSQSVDGDRWKGLAGELLNFPQAAGTREVAQKVSSKEAMENLQIMEGTQRLLHTNVQEALALEVGMLKLHL